MSTVSTVSVDNDAVVHQLLRPHHLAYEEWNPDHCTIHKNTLGSFIVFDHNLQVAIATSESYPALVRWLSKQL